VLPVDRPRVFLPCVVAELARLRKMVVETSQSQALPVRTFERTHEAFSCCCGLPTVAALAGTTNPMITTSLTTAGVEWHANLAGLPDRSAGRRRTRRPASNR